MYLFITSFHNQGTLKNRCKKNMFNPSVTRKFIKKMY